MTNGDKVRVLTGKEKEEAIARSREGLNREITRQRRAGNIKEKELGGETVLEAKNREAQKLLEEKRKIDFEKRQIAEAEAIRQREINLHLQRSQRNLKDSGREQSIKRNEPLFLEVTDEGVSKDIKREIGRGGGASVFKDTQLQIIEDKSDAQRAEVLSRRAKDFDEFQRRELAPPERVKIKKFGEGFRLEQLTDKARELQRDVRREDGLASQVVGTNLDVAVHGFSALESFAGGFGLEEEINNRAGKVDLREKVRKGVSIVREDIKQKQLKEKLLLTGGILLTAIKKDPFGFGGQITGAAASFKVLDPGKLKLGSTSGKGFAKPGKFSSSKGVSVLLKGRPVEEVVGFEEISTVKGLKKIESRIEFKFGKSSLFKPEDIKPPDIIKISFDKTQRASVKPPKVKGGKQSVSTQFVEGIDLTTKGTTFIKPKVLEDILLKETSFFRRVGKGLEKVKAKKGVIQRTSLQIGKQSSKEITFVKGVIEPIDFSKSKSLKPFFDKVKTPKSSGSKKIPILQGIISGSPSPKLLPGKFRSLDLKSGAITITEVTSKGKTLEFSFIPPSVGKKVSPIFGKSTPVKKTVRKGFIEKDLGDGLKILLEEPKVKPAVGKVKSKFKPLASTGRTLEELFGKAKKKRKVILLEEIQFFRPAKTREAAAISVRQLSNVKLDDPLRVVSETHTVTLLKPSTKKAQRSVQFLSPKVEQVKGEFVRQEFIRSSRSKTKAPISKVGILPKFDTPRPSTTTFKPITAITTSQVTTTSLLPKTRLKPRSSLSPDKKKLFNRLLGTSKRVQLFDVQVKRGGKFFTIKRDVGRFAGLDIGARRTKKTLAATFRLVKTKKGKAKKIPLTGDFSSSKSQFRPFKVKKGKKIQLIDTFIQKKGFRLGTKSERRAIQKARRIKIL